MTILSLEEIGFYTEYNLLYWIILVGVFILLKKGIDIYNDLD